MKLDILLLIPRLQFIIRWINTVVDRDNFLITDAYVIAATNTNGVRFITVYPAIVFR